MDRRRKVYPKTHTMTYKERPALTLREAIEEAQQQREILMIADPYERAGAIADYLRKEFPFAWQIETMQDEAARAVGVPTNAELERMYSDDLETEGVLVVVEQGQLAEEPWTWSGAWLHSAKWATGAGMILLPFWDKAWQVLLGAAGFWVLSLRVSRGRHEKI